MKKVLLLAVAAALLAAPAFGGISGTKHDLSSASSPNAAGLKGTNDNGQICVYCHTPHGATAVGVAPLWNRSGTYTINSIYSSNTLNANITTSAVQNSDAPLCLSCHSGTALAGTLNNPPNNSTGFAAPTGNLAGTSKDIGLDLNNDHPIGFVFAASATDEIQAPTYAKVNFGAASNEMWCSSCHDVHGGTAGTPFLVVSNSGSALCLDCHMK